LVKSGYAAWSLALALFITAEAGANEEPPSMELLEFLGGWEDDNGQWIDPLELLPAQEEPEDEGNNEGTDNE
jgi:hypothetical protein